MLLWTGGHIVIVLTLFAIVVYLFGTVVWMHAPLLAVLLAAAPVTLLALGLAWLCRHIGRRLRDDVPVLPASQSRRWLLAAIGIAMVGAIGATVHTGVKEYQCGVDRYRNAAARQSQAQREGFERVCERDLARWDVSFLPNAIATRNLAFTPVDLAHTRLARFESLGSRAETAFDVRSRLYRGFRMPDGHRVILYEEDMSANGITTRRRPEDEPERINGLPARLVVQEAPSGKAVSLLSWVEGRRDYQMWIDANIARVPLRGQLFALAASIPRAVPACPNETQPQQVPRELTRAQVDAMLDRSKRPCK
jgi:hypothetical protein